jgi:hypothetical protein
MGIFCTFTNRTFMGSHERIRAENFKKTNLSELRHRLVVGGTLSNCDLWAAMVRLSDCIHFSLVCMNATSGRLLDGSERVLTLVCSSPCLFFFFDFCFWLSVFHCLFSFLFSPRRSGLSILSRLSEKLINHFTRFLFCPLFNLHISWT